MEFHCYGNSDNPKLILVHGFQCPVTIWKDVAERFCQQYCVIAAVLEGHSLTKKEEFVSFDHCCEAFEEEYISRFGREAYAVYVISMGGVFTAKLWERRRIHFDKIIMESSPLLPFGKLFQKMSMRFYLKKAHQSRHNDPKALAGAERMMGKNNAADFLTVVKNMSDDTVKAYLQEVYNYRLPEKLPMEGTQLYYYYGGNMAELPFAKTAKYIQKQYPSAHTGCFEGKGHCEGLLTDPKAHVAVLENILRA